MVLWDHNYNVSYIPATYVELGSIDEIEIMSTLENISVELWVTLVPVLPWVTITLAFLLSD
jgi:hypothetical protein